MSDDLTIAIIPIDDLVYDPVNARKHNDENLGMIRKSLSEVGAMRSIVIDENNVVLAGNATLKMAKVAGIEFVAVVRVSGQELVAVQRSGLTDDQKRRYALFDNRASELASWDLAALKEISTTFDLATLFSDSEMLQMGLCETPASALAGDQSPINERAPGAPGFGEPGAAGWFKFREWDIPMTAEEKAGIQTEMCKWADKTGTYYGFIGHLLEIVPLEDEVLDANYAKDWHDE